MNSRHHSTSKSFLILVFTCAIFVSATQAQARDRHTGARLIVQRAANFGTELVLHLEIDGRTMADIQRDRHYDGFVPAGRHVLTARVLPNIERRRPTVMPLTVQAGRTYIFTAMWDADRLILRRARYAGRPAS
jgi:hypothetical protein